MSRNLYRVWITLLIISGGIAAWFSGSVATKLWKYSRLTNVVPASVLKWEIRDLPSSRFAVEAEYNFEIGQVSYSNKTIFEYPQFLNHYAAENYLKQLRVKEWKAWYRAGNPALSSLEKEFPQKECLQALLTLGVFAYFFFARSLLSKLF